MCCSFWLHSITSRWGRFTFPVGEENLFCLLPFPLGTLSPSHLPSFTIYTTLKIGGITLFRNVQNRSIVMNFCWCYKLDEWLVEEEHLMAFSVQWLPTWHSSLGTHADQRSFHSALGFLWASLGVPGMILGLGWRREEPRGSLFSAASLLPSFISPFPTHLTHSSSFVCNVLPRSALSLWPLPTMHSQDINAYIQSPTFCLKYRFLATRRSA